MAYIITDAQHYTDIADSLRDQLLTDEQYYPASMAAAIQRVPRPYKPSFSNGFRGIEVARLAASYRLAKELGDDNIAYAHGSLPFSDVTLDDVIAAGGLQVRDSSGVGKCDCSIFMGLVLRGIDWLHSFYHAHTAANALWDPATELDAMYGEWGDWALDHQAEGAYHDLGLSGRSTIRLVKDFALYLRKTGHVIYDADRDGALTTEILSSLEPGDVCMQKADGATDTTIVHMFVVAERNIRLWECTEGLTPNLSYSSVSSRMSNIQLIVRPDYRINAKAGAVPIGVELLKWPWTSIGAAKTYSESGMSFIALDDQSMQLFGTTSAAVTLYLRGLSTTDFLTLVPGVYRLSGMTGTGVLDANLALQVRKSDGTDLSPSVRCYDGHDADFTVDETTGFYFQVRLYTGSGKTLNCPITPSLVRLS